MTRHPVPRPSPMRWLRLHDFEVELLAMAIETGAERERREGKHELADLMCCRAADVRSATP